MGWASRARQAGGDSRSELVSLVFDDDAFAAKRLFRVFETAEHADAFVQGIIRISTLRACRTYENAARGDQAEGTIRYHSGSISGTGADPAVQVVAHRLSLGVGPSTNITIENSYAEPQIDDAYVLCMTERDIATEGLQALGQFCVAIERPRVFARAVTDALVSCAPVAHARAGRVAYQEFLVGANTLPASIGFFKDPDKYRDQAEVRIVWYSYPSQGLEPIFVRCPGITKLLTRSR